MQAVELRLRPSVGAFPGVDSDFAAAREIERHAILNLDWLGDGELVVLFHLDAPAAEPIEAIAEQRDDVSEYEVIEIEDGSYHTYLHLKHSDFVSELRRLMREYALLLHRPIRFDGDSIIVTIAGDEEIAGDAFMDLQDIVDLSVEWTGTYRPLDKTPLAKLTDRQREALETAYDIGFYETPREASYDDLAEELDCAPSTANALLHRSEAALIEAVLDR